jgi:hypothetical protein
MCQVPFVGDLTLNRVCGAPGRSREWAVLARPPMGANPEGCGSQDSETYPDDPL